jgi:hypothetical protein
MKHLKWNESASYMWARARHYSGPPKWWYLHMLAAGTAGGLFVLGQIAKWFRGGKSQMTIWTEITICLGVGFVFGYWAPILSMFASCRVWTNDRGLHRKSLEVGHVTVETWPWERIAGYQIDRVIYNGKGFDELRVKLTNGGEVRIGLDGQQLKSQFAEVFRAYAQGGKQGS